MVVPFIRACLYFVVSISASNILASDYQQGSYPSFSQARLFTTGETVVEKPNIVLSAIEKGTSVDLKFNSSFLDAKRFLFPSKKFGSSYQVDKLASQAFVDSISMLVEQFACAEYRFRNRLAESYGCDGYVHDSDKLEKMPFVSGQFLSNRMEINLDDRMNGVSFNTYLNPSNEKPLSSVFGSVHQLGNFFGKFADRRSLVLSVNVEAFWWNPESKRIDRINGQPEVYFLILPKSEDISNQKDQKSAAKFAINNTKILVVGG